MNGLTDRQKNPPKTADRPSRQKKILPKRCTQNCIVRKKYIKSYCTVLSSGNTDTICRDPSYSFVEIQTIRCVLQFTSYRDQANTNVSRIKRKTVAATQPKYPACTAVYFRVRSSYGNGFSKIVAITTKLLWYGTVIG